MTNLDRASAPSAQTEPVVLTRSGEAAALPLDLISALSALDEHAVFTLDGEATTLLEIVEADDEAIGIRELYRIACMRPGESLLLGGGAGADFTLARVR